MKQSPAYRILFENHQLVAVDKAAGIAVIADRYDDSCEGLDKLLNSYYKSLGLKTTPEGSSPSETLPERVYVVHRLDRETSGVVVLAKNPVAHRLLSKAFQSRLVAKRYLAVVHGRVFWQETSCDLALLPNGDRQHRTVIDKAKGKASFTSFRRLGTSGNFSVLEVKPETGRSHQIRVHAAAIGHPIVCDPLYGKAKPIFLSSFKRGWRGNPHNERPLLARLGLHAESISLPIQAFSSLETDSESALSIKAPLARDMAALIRQLEKASGTAFADLSS